MSWSREQVTILLEEVMKYPCLYAVKTKAYSNKHLRQQAWINVEKALKNAKSINEIKTKYTGLKATFTSEHKKHLNSIHSGADEEEIYYPNLWYYDKFRFILDHINPRESMDSIDMGQENNVNVANTHVELETMTQFEDYESNEEVLEEYIVNDDGSIIKSTNEQGDELSRSSSSMSTYKKASTPKRKRGSSTENTDVMREAATALHNINRTINEKISDKSKKIIDNEDVALANFIISKLRQISDETVRLDVEEEIVRVLFNGIKKCKK